MGPVELEARMRGRLSSGEYRALLFEDRGEVVAYALFQECADEVHLRQFFVVRHRRREGLGRAAMKELFEQHWPRSKRVAVSVLTKNTVGVAFWRALDYSDYDLTLEILPR
jgi:predicted acetyltransferase